MSKLGEIKVVLADDNFLMRDGIRNLLCQDSQIRLVGEARNGAEAIALIEQCLPHIVLLDIEMPILDGIETARLLRTGYPDVQIIFLSAYDDRFLIDAICEEGWSGYVVKDHAPATLVKTIRTFSGSPQAVVAPQ